MTSEAQDPAGWWLARELENLDREMFREKIMRYAVLGLLDGPMDPDDDDEEDEDDGA